MAITPVVPDNRYTNGAVIAYENLITSSDDTTPADGSPKAVIPNTYERWRPANGTSTERFNLLTNADVNFVAIGAHNLSGQTITIQYSTTDGGGLTTLTTVTPSSNEPILVTFDAVEVSEIAINATWANDREIGYIATGQYLKMPYPIYGGHTPITLNPETEYQNNISESGQFLGRNIVRQGVSTDYSFRYLDPDFIRGDFNAFVDSARTKPFFMQWRPDLYSEEVAFGYTTGDVKVSNSGGGIRLMDASFSMKGHRDI